MNKKLEQAIKSFTIRESWDLQRDLGLDDNQFRDKIIDTRFTIQNLIVEHENLNTHYYDLIEKTEDKVDLINIVQSIVNNIQLFNMSRDLIALIGFSLQIRYIQVIEFCDNNITFAIEKIISNINECSDAIICVESRILPEMVKDKQVDFNTLNTKELEIVYNSMSKDELIKLLVKTKTI